MDGETHFPVNGYSQTINIGFYAEQCLGSEMAYATPPWTRLYQKSLLDVFISLHGWCKALVMENGSIDAFNCSRQYQPMTKESIDANYQLVGVSFGQDLLRHNIKKVSPNRAGNGEYLLWQRISCQNCKDTNSSNGNFLCSADPRFLY